MAIEAPATSPVLDNETLFRAVRDESIHFSCDAAGALRRLSHSVFNDPDMQPSVDRATLRLGVAAESRKSPSDGVVALIAVEVRSIKALVSRDSKGKPTLTHDVDVIHAPEADNYTHALVRTAPQVASSGTFKRLKEALCLIAEAKGWAFPPQSARRL